MGFELSIIKGQVIHELIHQQLEVCVRVVRDAYLAHHAGQSVNPSSYFLLFPEKPSSRIIALPAYLGGGVGVSGIKWIASYPENVKKGFPRASAVLVLNDYETGYPFAFLESSIISASRTAASAVLAAQWLNGGKKAARSIGFVGNGLIARYLYDFFVGTGWALDEVHLYDTSAEEAARFAREVVRPGEHKRVVTHPDLPSLMKASEVIVFATVAGKPHVHDPALLDHAPLVLHVSLRDLAPELILSAQNFVDDVDHCLKANTSVHLTEQRQGNREFLHGTLGEVMTGSAKVDLSRPRIFSPFGLGVLDLAVGKWVHDQARAAGRDVRMNDFFFELTR